MIYLKDSKIQIKSSYQMAKVFQDLLLLEAEIDREKEHFYVMHLNAKCQVKMVELASLGSLTASVVHPRETFRRAVLAGSASIIVAHNHPSGDVELSTEDTKVTKLLFEAGRVLGIPLLDHLIFANESFFSFQENRIRSIEEDETGKEKKNL
jgi:DNA repair protein RadC